MTAAPQAFDQRKGAGKSVSDEKGPLYEQIGRLHMDRGAGAIELAQKKLGINPQPNGAPRPSDLTLL